MKYLSSAKLGWKDILGLENQSLWQRLNSFEYFDYSQKRPCSKRKVTNVEICKDWEKWWILYKPKGVESLQQSSNFLIPISLKPDDENLRHFKLRLFDLTEFIDWNM